MRNSVFNTESPIDHMTAQPFLDPNGGVVLQRYDQMRYPQIDRMIQSVIGWFWRPEEVELGKDQMDFNSLTDHEQHIFTSNLKRQILLDSVQGRSPSLTFLPMASLPEIEGWITLWALNETIHSRSYTHIIRRVYNDPSVVFDDITSISEIVDCAKDISYYYDELIEMSGYYQLLGEGTHTITSKTPYVDKFQSQEQNTHEVVISRYELKKALWMAIMSVNILEGVRFYVSFACSWAFAELKKMDGNAAIIRLICRDENMHLAFTQLLLKLLPRDDPDFVKIEAECREESIRLFYEAVDQEKRWAHYLFQGGSMIGLNEELLSNYIEWIAKRRMEAIELPCKFTIRSNPFPWTEKWISGKEMQPAPQEVEKGSYQVGAVNQDVSADTFKGFSL